MNGRTLHPVFRRLCRFLGCSGESIKNGKTLRAGHARRGLMLAAVLATLVVVAIAAAAVTRSLVTHSRQVRIAQQRQQSFWLAESAMQRALSRLSASPEYSGETWNLPSEQMDGVHAAAVKIAVQPSQEPKGVWVRVEARYPDDPMRRIVYSRERFVPVASQGASS